MDFRLQVFKKVADKLNFTKASEELFISQPAVSKHIRELETKYNVQLFERQGNKIKLTQEGKVLLNYANQLLDIYKNMENYFLGINNQINKNVVFGASSTISQYIVPKLIYQLKKTYPEVKFTLINGNSSEIEELILKKEIDFGIIEGKHNNPLLEYEFFIEDEIVLLTKNNENSKFKNFITAEELKKTPLVLREKGSGTRDIIEENLKKIAVNPNDLFVDLTLGNTESIKNYLLNSESFSFISIHAVQEELKEKKLQIVDVKNLEITRKLYFVKVQGDHSSTYTSIKQLLTNSYN
ncbi:DNA-binding transcriptional regulator, LysR family [Mesonia phycicola]|uniref:DNA-binding transcriptional regulator, LysR family n=1 Tax=Mesonia phycicola TaxID=579105 RepID=A0A1M6DVN6_9FLAO|nr:LysR substrate-binding domain-containing protein [Mesonia phycicola]SHI77314.1 DNA-binding transcriptional regulator, LysR family [Mesonia phycicola]